MLRGGLFLWLVRLRFDDFSVYRGSVRKTQRRFAHSRAGFVKEHPEVYLATDLDGLLDLTLKPVSNFAESFNAACFRFLN